jgi:hypothetical protein
LPASAATAPGQPTDRPAGPSVRSGPGHRGPRLFSPPAARGQDSHGVSPLRVQASSESDPIRLLPSSAGAATAVHCRSGDSEGSAAGGQVPGPGHEWPRAPRHGCAGPGRPRVRQCNVPQSPGLAVRLGARRSRRAKIQPAASRPARAAALAAAAAAAPPSAMSSGACAGAALRARGPGSVRVRAARTHLLACFIIKQ